MIYSTLAFTAAQDESPLSNFMIPEFFYYLDWYDLAFQDYHLTLGDIDVSCDVEYNQSVFKLNSSPLHGVVPDGFESLYKIQFNLTK